MPVIHSRKVVRQLVWLLRDAWLLLQRLWLALGQHHTEVLRVERRLCGCVRLRALGRRLVTRVAVPPASCRPVGPRYPLARGPRVDVRPPLCPPTAAPLLPLLPRGTGARGARRGTHAAPGHPPLPPPSPFLLFHRPPHLCCDGRRIAGVRTRRRLVLPDDRVLNGGAHHGCPTRGARVDTPLVPLEARVRPRLGSRYRDVDGSERRRWRLRRRLHPAQPPGVPLARRLR